MSTNQYQNIRTIVKGLYDLQHLRIEVGNRMVAQFRAKLGCVPSVKAEETLGEDELELLKTLKVDFKKITDGIKKELPAKKDFKANGLISDYTELCLIKLSPGFGFARAA